MTAEPTLDTPPMNNTDIMQGRHYLIFIKGTVKGNSGSCGWGMMKQLRDGNSVIRQGAKTGQPKEATMTHVRAEMLAALAAVESVKETRTPTVVMTSSELLCNGMVDGLPRWKASGWVGSDGGFVKNQDIWKRLEAASTGKHVEWRYVGAKESATTPLARIAKALSDDAAKGSFPKGASSIRAKHPDLFIDR